MFFVACGILVYSSSGQQVKVIDQLDFNPIEHVSISDLGGKAEVLTGRTGSAFLGGFSESDTLVFRHTSYSTLLVPFGDLAGIDYTVKLAERSIRLQEFVVSASKWEQKREEVPNQIEVITAREIAFGNAQTAADLLGQTGEIFIQKSQQGGGSPMIRGFSANSLLIAIDGVRMNNAIYRSGNLHNVNSIDAQTLESAEVIFGPGTVIYGSDALGGVMDFHTRSPVLAADERSFSSAGWLVRYATVNNERTGHLDLNLASRKFGSLTSFTFSLFDDLVMGNVGHDDYRRLWYADWMDGKDVMVSNPNPDRQRYSGYDQFNVLQKFLYRPASHAELQYAFHYSGTSDVTRYDRLIQYNEDSTQRYAEWYYGPQEWMMHSVTGKWMKPNIVFTEARLVAAYQNYKESRHSRKFGKTSLLEQWEDVDVLSLNADLEKNLTSDDFLFYGLEALYNDVVSSAKDKDISDGSSVPTGPRYPDGTNHYTVFSAYMNYKHNFRQKSTLLAGLRYNYADLYSTIDDTSFYHFPFTSISLKNSALNGSIGFTYHPGRQYQFNINFSTGFRSPNLDDVGKVFDSEPGSVVVPNPGLKPEYAYNFELGFLKDFNGKASLELNGFYTLLEDVMVRGDFTFNGHDSIYYLGDLSKVQAMVNADGAYIYGGSIALEAVLSPMFSARTVLSYAYGEDDEGNSIRHAPPVFGSTYLTFRMEQFRAELFAVYNGEIPYERLTPTEQAKPYMYATDDNGNPYSPGWWTLNLKTSYQFNPHLSLDLGLENILNQRYRPYSSGIAAPGRNIYVTLRGKI
jgi:hemoglobin/transferrin/lactoferrin receptor protein